MFLGERASWNCFEAENRRVHFSAIYETPFTQPCTSWALGAVTCGRIGSVMKKDHSALIVNSRLLMQYPIL